MREKKMITVNELGEQWLKYVYLHVKYSTCAQYERTVKAHIAPYFFDMKIEDLSFEFLQQYIQYLATSGNRRKKCGLSPKTINDILLVLKAMLNYLSLHGSREFDLPSIQLLRVPQKTVSVFEEADYQKLQKYLTENINLSKLGILICLYTGLRIGEICALQWKNIDLDRELLCVSQTVYRTKNPENTLDAKISSSSKTKIILSSPKTWHSERKVPLSANLLKILKQFSLKYDKDIFVVTGTDCPMDPRTYQYQYRKYLKECHIPYLSFHSLRHTFSTRCIENGCDIKSLSEMLGHASTNVTLQKYVFSSYAQKKHFIDLL